MSLSKRPRDSDELVTLVAEAKNPSIEIFIIDSQFDVIASGLEVLEARIFPGIYKVKFKAGSLIEEVLVTLEPGSKPVHVPAPKMAFSTALPIENTRTESKRHTNPAERHSRNLHVDLGNDSQIFVFVRDLKPDRQIDVASGLSLHDIEGNNLVEFTETGFRSEITQWMGCNVEVDPGLYRLRVQTEVIGRLEQLIVACEGWQTQVYLLNRSYKRAVSAGANRYARRADLSNASIIMKRMGEGFNPEGGDLRQTELARLGLKNNRPVANARDLNDMLWAKYENPMLGILGAHLLLLENEPDSETLATVTKNLRKLVGNHLDVRCLQYWLDLEKNVKPDSAPFLYPPMLKSSWNIILTASARYPNLIPADSLAGSIATQVWGDGPWLTWITPSGETEEEPGDVRLSTSLSRSFIQLSEALEERGGLIDETGLDSLEKSILNYIAPLGSEVISEAPTPKKKQRDTHLTDVTKKANMRDKEIVRALGVPKSVARQAAGNLAKKIISED